MPKPFLVSFNYQVVIMDDGEPTQLSSTTLVVILVSDVNDNSPEFDQKTYNVEVPSNAQIDQKLFQVSFNDEGWRTFCIIIIESIAPLFRLFYIRTLYLVIMICNLFIIG
jgi:hypothetical protein